MRTPIIIFSAAALFSLAACEKSSSDKLADQVENAADARADVLENTADALANRADRLDDRAAEIRETGEQRSDAIDAADRDVSGITEEKRKAIVANEAAAVR